MKDAADFKHCEKLYKLSGWRTGSWYGLPLHYGKDEKVAAYDCDFILNRLPPWINFEGNYYNFSLHTSHDQWYASYGGTKRVAGIPNKMGKTPANALVRLAIAMFEGGLLSAG